MDGGLFYYAISFPHFVFFIFYLTIKIRENKRKMKENKIETKSIVFNSDTDSPHLELSSIT